MQKTILLTGATDGLGAEAAILMASQGHHLIVHGRDEARLAQLQDRLTASASPDAKIEMVLCDLSSLKDVNRMADDLLARGHQIDVIINNAGVLKAPNTTTAEGFELRFVVNVIAPYLLVKKLLPSVPDKGRIVNLSSAAQNPLDAQEITRCASYSDMGAYAKSKLAITAWTKALSDIYQDYVFVSVNPGSLLGTKMVKEGFGIDGADIMIGADIIFRAALSDEFEQANGLYYDNDAKQFGPPHELAQETVLGQALIHEMDALLSQLNLG